MGLGGEALLRLAVSETLRKPAVKPCAHPRLCWCAAANSPVAAHAEVSTGIGVYSGCMVRRRLSTILLVAPCRPANRRCIRQTTRSRWRLHARQTGRLLRHLLGALQRTRPPATTAGTAASLPPHGCSCCRSRQQQPCRWLWSRWHGLQLPALHPHPQQQQASCSRA